MLCRRTIFVANRVATIFMVTCAPLVAATDKGTAVVSPEVVGTCSNWTFSGPISTGAMDGGAATSDGIAAYVAGGSVNPYSLDGLNYFRRFDLADNRWVLLAPMPDGNARASAVYCPTNNKVYVFGGTNSAGIASDTRIYDIATNSWSAGAGMPAARWSMGAGYHNGKIYLVGGYATSSSSSAQSQLWEYDPLADSWNTGRLAMPQPTAGAAFGIINGHFYVTGGPSNSNAMLYAYDFATNTWARRADPPGALYSYASAVLDGQLKLFSVGSDGPLYDPASNTWLGSLGFRAEGTAGTVIGRTLFAAGGKYYPGMLGWYYFDQTCTSICLSQCQSGSWTSKASYPVALQSPAVTSDGAFLYSTGGLTSGGPSSGSYRYDLIGDTWTHLPPLPIALYGGRGAYAANTHSLYVFGGRNSDQVLNSTFRYDFAANTWISAAAMPGARYLASVAYYSGSGKIYVIGGFDANGNETNDTWEYDPVADTWNTSRSSIPTPTAASGTGIAGQFIYLIGTSNGGAGSSMHIRYDIVNDTWAILAPAPVSLNEPAVAVLGGRIYVMGVPMAAKTSAGNGTTYIYDIGSDAWSSGPSTMIAHEHGAGVGMKGRILVFGGSSSMEKDTSTMESLTVACPDCPNLLSETFDNVTPPALPAGWTASNAQGPAPLWATSAASPDVQNNAFADAPNTVSDKRLDTPGVQIPSKSAQVSFQSLFNFGQAYMVPAHDGAVMELSSPNINNGAFTDITDPAVSGSFVSGGYTGIIAQGFVSPIAGRRAWISYASFPQDRYIETIANLGPNIANQTIKLRFRLGADNNSDTGSWRIDNVVVTPETCPPVLLSAVSRKVHGGAGVFDISLPIAGTPGIECRSAGSAGGYQLILTFANSISFSGVLVTAGTGTATANIDGTTVSVDLTEVTNGQTITVMLANADDGANRGNIFVSMRLLVGDVNGDGVVNATDISKTKLESGQALNDQNFREDVNASGSINASDVMLVKSLSGTALQPGVAKTVSGQR